MISKWPIPPYVKGVIIDSTLNRNRETQQNWNIYIYSIYFKNESNSDYTWLHILSAGPQGLKCWKIL